MPGLYPHNAGPCKMDYDFWRADPCELSTGPGVGLLHSTPMASLRTLETALQRLRSAFSDLPDIDEAFPLSLSESDSRRLTDVLLEVADRLHDNYPYFHPLYAGQMLKPPHPVARLAYELALQINPNNHALDGGRASSAMEKEAVAAIARMIGWDTHLGHLCSGGTMANLEALWVAGQLHPGKTVVASTQAHYTHQRIAGVLGLPFETIPCDRAGRIDTAALSRRLAAGGVGTIVATMGTTATGAVDPLDAIVELRSRYDFRIHADAAYGGYFLLVKDLDAQTRRAFDRIAEAASVVIDPHKHGLQPYGCGAAVLPRLPVHLLHVDRNAPRGDLVGVFTTGRRGRRALGNAAAVPTRLRWRVRAGSNERARCRARAVRAAAKGWALRDRLGAGARHHRLGAARQTDQRSLRTLPADL